MVYRPFLTINLTYELDGSEAPLYITKMFKDIIKAKDLDLMHTTTSDR